MAASRTDQLTHAEVRCPTCRARQPWSDTCRRCKSDLSLLRDVAESSTQSRRLCLRALCDGRYLEAVSHARRSYHLSPSPGAARLLSVCHLMAGQWSKALSAARLAEDS